MTEWNVQSRNKEIHKQKSIKQNQNIKFKNDKQALKQSENQYIIIKHSIYFRNYDNYIQYTCFYNLDKRNSTLELE